MHTDQIAHFLIQHIEAVVQWTAFAVVALVTVFIARSFLGRDDEVAGEGGEGVSSAAVTADTEAISQAIVAKISEMETKIVQWQSQAAVSGKAGDTGASAPDPSLKEELERLRAELSARESQIKKLKEEMPKDDGGATPASSDLTGKLNDQLKRIEELEAKLAEYEILEDDIADLSLYKEENARLKAELDSVKGGGGSATETPAEPAAAPSTAGKEDLVAEFAQAIEQMPGIGEGDSSSKDLPKTENPMADFESAVKATNEETASEPAAAAPAATAASPAPTGDSMAESNDIFSEMTSDTLDTDKMMEELSGLQELEPATEGAETLDQDIDTEKMSEEATELSKKA